MAESPKKSALPDFEEIVGIFGKLCSDLKSSLSEIAEDFKSLKKSLKLKLRLKQSNLQKKRLRKKTKLINLS